MRKIIAVLLLVALPCVSYAYNDWYKSALKSVFNAKETGTGTEMGLALPLAR